MPADSLPAEDLGVALYRMGLDRADQKRSTLRTLVHLLVGEPPGDYCSADDLAAALLAAGNEKGTEEVRRVMEQRLLPG